MKEDKYLWIVVLAVSAIIGLEYLLSQMKGKRIFRFENTISNFLMGIFDRIAGIFMVPLIYIYYRFLYQNFSLLEVPRGLIWFIFAVLVSDFVWYFYHRCSHRINLFWGAHIIHHQSEDYNYSVALNLTPFQVLIRVLFWSVMPIVGFSAEVVLGTHIVIGLYQFLLHTTLIPKLGILERIFVTPSHHRVHHGSNYEYIDKNYGGVLIIWDRLFGTFQQEKNKVVYGITKDIDSRDFMTTVFHYYQNLIFQMRQLTSLKEKIKLLFKSPDWIPVSGILKSLPLYINKGSYKYRKFSEIKKGYIILNTLGILILVITFTCFVTFFSAIDMFAISIFVLLTLVIVGRLLENKKAYFLEITRGMLVLVWLIINLK